MKVLFGNKIFSKYNFLVKAKEKIVNSGVHGYGKLGPHTQWSEWQDIATIVFIANGKMLKKQNREKQTNKSTMIFNFQHKEIKNRQSASHVTKKTTTQGFGKFAIWTHECTFQWAW